MFTVLAVVLSAFTLSHMTDIDTSIMVVLSIVLIIATLVDTNIGLIAILLSMLLSPELEAGATHGREITVRAEDLLLIIVSFTWLAKMAFKKDAPLIRPSAVNAQIGIYSAILCFSTLLGMVIGNVNPAKGAFYVLKLLEYFILFFMVLNNVTSEKQVKMFLVVMLVTGSIVALYANSMIGHISRVSAPFERSEEPNTLGGYVLFMLSMVAGLIFHYREKRGLFIILFILLVPTFIFTLSRSSYMGLLPALLALMLITRDKKVFIFAMIAAAAFLLLATFGPTVVKNRVLDTFRPEKAQELKSVGAIKLGPSPAERVLTWQRFLTREFPKRPIFGFGVTGIGFLDGQYVLVLMETGIAGFAAFSWLLFRLFLTALRAYRAVEKPLNKGIVLGFMVGMSGLLVQAVGTNTFVIIRIAEPFWFFAAIVLRLVDIETGKAALEEAASPFRRW